MDTNTLAAHEPVATDTRGRRISALRHRPIKEKRAIVAESLRLERFENAYSRDD
jgi:hypothetical protein